MSAQAAALSPWPRDKLPATKEELAAAMREQAWRLNNLYWIKDKDGRKVQFKMNWAQQEFFERLWFRSLILKARQIGFSTIIDLMLLDTALFNRNTSCGIVAHNEESAKEIFSNNVSFPYEHLPPTLRRALPPTADSGHKMAFPNGSSIRVATTMRGGTLQMLHVSEFGKICAKFPDRAREVVTGSLEAVSQDNIVVIESTAEGHEGYFYEYTQAARALQDLGKPLGRLDYRFFFCPWWREPSYRTDPATVVVPRELLQYFSELEPQIGVHLDEWQRAWYAAKIARLHEDMWREYPSTPDEAFRASLEGTYYTRQIAAARREGRICRIPPDPATPLNTFWDLGLDDFTAVWLHQRVGREHRFIAYYEHSGEPLQHYANWLWEWRGKGLTFDRHFFPHDVRQRSLKDDKALLDTVISLGLAPAVVVDTPDLLAGIQRVRDVLAGCWFDETECAKGIERLESYRKDWNERMGCYSSRPRHDDASHGADAFRIFAQGWQEGPGADAYAGLFGPAADWRVA